MRIDIHVGKSVDLKKLQEMVQAIAGDPRCREDDRRAEEINRRRHQRHSDQLFTMLGRGAGRRSVPRLQRDVGKRDGRRHDIGVLRAIGATRSRSPACSRVRRCCWVRRAVLGIPLGVSRQHGHRFRQRRSQRDVPEPGYPTDKAEYRDDGCRLGRRRVDGLLAALVPAVQAANDEPADAVRRAPSEQTASSVRFTAPLASC